MHAKQLTEAITKLADEATKLGEARTARKLRLAGEELERFTAAAAPAPEAAPPVIAEKKKSPAGQRP